MNDMRRKSPREFWKMFKSKPSQPKGENISKDDFLAHFKNLASHSETDENDECTDFLDNFQSNIDGDGSFSELDLPISISEIVAASKLLGTNKACSFDNILYEYFKESIHVISHSLEITFNHILNTQKFPVSWSTGVIIPLYKKGESSDPNNYRGITLISCFAKLFTVILNERLKKWSAQKLNDILTDAQFGFKPNYSTVDAIFMLNSIIEKLVI